MGDPLFTPALVGYAVSVFFTEVVNAAKSAIGHKKKCRILSESVKKLQCCINKANDDSANWEEVESKWLKEIKDLLVKAENFAAKGLEESKSEKWKRGMTFWQWGKLPTELLDIVRQIEEAKENVVFGAALLACKNASKPKYATDFVTQDVPSYIVGVDEPFRKLKQSILAAQAENTASYFGLHGRGGAGKTLLAQMLHNDKDIKDAYLASSIMWITVGRDAKVGTLYNQMATYLKDAGFEKTYGQQSLKEQRNYLKNVLSKKRVFLILDDVWQQHCEDHHEMIYWLNIATASGSATLLTSRNTSLLSRARAKSEVVLSLSEEDSWKLFRAHAFEDNNLPSTISKELAKDVCKECKGLPLALKVLGSAMVDKVREEEWRSALHQLRRSQPVLGSTEEEVLFGRLQLSYDELSDDVQKTCFLYVGAFPEDYKIPTEKLFEIWVSEELFGPVDKEEAMDKAKTHLGLLEKRSLIEWNCEEEYVKVHDVVRDLALHIIDKAKPSECAYTCFFQTSDVSKSFPSSERLQAIEHMSFMNNTSFPRWPKDVGAPNLKVLLLSSIKSNEMQSDVLNFGGFTSLKYLDLSECAFLEELLASIGKLTCLTTLDLYGCISLKELPSSIGDLKCLTTLSLPWCESLKELPASIGELKCVTTLDLSGSQSLEELPASIGELKCLTTLNLSWCESLKELRASIGELNCLTTLNLSGCKSLKELPASIGELKCLTSLNLSSCESLEELATSIGKLSCLAALNLPGCESLEELPASIGKLMCLTTLDLSLCASLEKLPASIGKLKCLTTLDLSWCKLLKELPANICKLKCLITLNLSWCKSIKELPESIGELNCLTTLNLTGCESLEELPASIGELKCMTSLFVYGCHKLSKKALVSIVELKGPLLETDSVLKRDPFWIY